MTTARRRVLMRLKSIKIYETNDAREYAKNKKKKRSLSSKLNSRQSYTICTIIITSTRAENVIRRLYPYYYIDSEICTQYIRRVIRVGFWGIYPPPEINFCRWTLQYAEIKLKLNWIYIMVLKPLLKLKLPYATAVHKRSWTERARTRTRSDSGTPVKTETTVGRRAAVVTARPGPVLLFLDFARAAQ